MQKLNLVYLLIGLCFCFESCLYSVKPKYKIEKFETHARPKAEMGFVNEDPRGAKAILSGVIDFIEYSANDKEKIRISIAGGGGEKENDFGKIGLINFCVLIPCWKPMSYSISVLYSVDGEKKKEEHFTEEQTLWIWSPLVLYNIFTLSSEKTEFEKNNFSRVLEKIAPNIAKSILAIENENKTIIDDRKLKTQKELSEWEKVNKKSIRNVVHYLESANEGEIRNQAENYLNNVLDKKVQTYLVNRYPFVKPFLKSAVLFPDGSDARELLFFQILSRLVLERDSQTGFRQEVKLYQKDGKIIWEIEDQGETNLLYFFPYKNNITLEKISRKSNLIEMTLNLNAAQYGEGVFRAAALFGKYSQYPLWKDLDIDFLDSFK
ncbi:hypothetical protein [Leptospira yasudae]|uniref:Lipoprotein n=1 Tax=Leptospira yasudae TaxID=2202201 RepID=A0ABX9LXA2_9LEPT|nr:hypothetical protein [Leptospira yasudae]RHX77482.1 hypothetical protein DLM77_20890 [Leptospira yasudae]